MVTWASRELLSLLLDSGRPPRPLLPPTATRLPGVAPPSLQVLEISPQSIHSSINFLQSLITLGYFSLSRFHLYLFSPPTHTLYSMSFMNIARDKNTMSIPSMPGNMHSQVCWVARRKKQVKGRGWDWAFKPKKIRILPDPQSKRVAGNTKTPLLFFTFTERSPRCQNSLQRAQAPCPRTPLQGVWPDGQSSSTHS